MNTPPIVRPGEAMCRLDDLADPAAKAFTLKFPDGEEVEIFVVRRGAAAFAYLNECPHQAYPLCDKDAGFLNLDGSRIVCAEHGATFGVENGQALSGPALPDGCLMRVPITLVNGEIRLAPR